MKTLRGKSLLVVCDHHLIYDGRSYFSANSLFFKFLKYFKPYFKEVALSAPVSYQKKINEVANYPFEEDLRVIARPAYKRLFIYYAFLPLFFLRNFSKMLRTFQKYDVIWIVAPSGSQLAAYWAARILKKPYFIYLIGNILSIHQSGPLRFLKNAIARFEHFINRKITRSGLVFALGKELGTMYGTSENTVKYVATNLIESKEVLSLNEWTKYHKKKSPLRLLCVTRLSQEKGLELAVDITGELIRAKTPAVLTIVGKGPYEAKIKEYVKNNKLEKAVSFAGFIKEKRKIQNLYRNSDYFLLTSVSEGIPKTLFEAQSAGSIVLSTRVGGAPEVVDHKKTGFLFDKRDPKDFTGVILSLEKDKQKKMKVVEGALKKASLASAEIQAKNISKAIADNLFNQK